MIAKFHSAPGHSMETTLTLSLPAPQSVRAARGEQQKEKVKDPKDKAISKKKEREEEKEREREQEREQERERQRELKEMEKDRTSHRTHTDRNVSYKDKFQKMREKYDKVTLTHEANQRDLEILNSKIKKLQAENDLLLDAMYLAEPGLFQQFFPDEPQSTSPSHHLQNDTQLPPHLQFSEHLPPPPPAQSSYYPTSMPPPPPPVSATSSTSGQPSMPPPLPPLPSPSTSMPPPSSASSNGTVTDRRGRANSSRRPSSASSSRPRRRSDAQGSGIPLAPEDLGVNGGRTSGDRTPVRRTPTPTRARDMDVDDLPLRSPRVNGNTPRSSHERRSMSGVPSMDVNGVRSPESDMGSRRHAELPPPLPMHDDDIMPERERDREAFRREPPPMNDDGVYSAYATVNSPDEEDDDEGKMDVDA